MVIGGIEVAHEHPLEVRAQHLIYHALVPAPPHEVALGGGAEGPHKPIHPVLPPAGLVPVHHRAAPDTVADGSDLRLGPPGHPSENGRDAAHAQVELLDRGQQPLDGGHGQASRLP